MQPGGLRRVDPIARIKERILIIIDKVMGHFQHHMAHHNGAMPHVIEFP